MEEQLRLINKEIEECRRMDILLMQGQTYRNLGRGKSLVTTHITLKLTPSLCLAIHLKCIHQLSYC